jgi:hypothetical protein
MYTADEMAPWDTKPTYTNHCLNARSHHHPANKQAVLSTLVHKSKAIMTQTVYTSPEHLPLQWLCNQQIIWALHPTKVVISPSTEDTNLAALLPFAGTTLNCINRVLSNN